MRGAPFLQAIILVAAFLLAGVPVYRLTRPAEPAVVASAGTVADLTADHPEAKPVPLEVEVVFAPAPVDFQIRNLDRTVLAGRGPQARFTTRWTTAMPAEGVDLVVQAHWPTTVTGGNAAATGAVPGANPAAARVTVRFPDGRQAEKSFWSGANGTIDEVFTVPGAAAPTAP